ncbi:hypothetical protein KQI38_07685 [Tissierella carlieri]|uniref:hypothetical protein n=1 Tax=Tissierella carlieri TaxID=689904 RepID=UPI001C0FAADC|nr:hypothetical protein [Tissierella carlieri]MBU5311908.1 hypothetical protein [Tissierella carlieri]
MNENELKEAYFELIKEDLNNFRDISELENAPKPIQLAVEKLIKYDSKDRTVQSEGIADLKMSYFEVKNFPADVKVMLNPYRKLRW